MRTIASGIVALALIFVPGLACAATINDRQSLVDAIDTARSGGLNVVYSTRYVKPWMRVRETPAVTELHAALDQALAHYGLTLEPAAGERWIVTRRAGSRVAPTAAAAPSTAAKLAAPPAEPALDELVVVASRHALYGQMTPAGQFLTGDDIRLLPHIADDAYRALHRLPGVSANDFSAPFNLRGGAGNEVKVMLDGVELFEPFHMRTLFNPLSLIDPGVIGEATLYSGGYGAGYGNHMSGVLEIVSRRADGAPLHEVGVSFVNAFARSRGSFADGAGGYQLSARRGYLDLLADSVTDDDEELTPRYSDLFARVDYEFAGGQRLAANVLVGDDDTVFADGKDGERFTGDSELRYGWVALDWPLADALSATATLFTGQVETVADGRRFNGPFDDVARFDDRDVSANGAELTARLDISDANQVTVGARYRRLSADYDYRLDSVRQTTIANNGAPYTLQRFLRASADGDEIGTFANWRLRPFDGVVVDAGVRWDKQTYVSRGDRTQTSPRLAALIALGDWTDLRIGWGRYYQPQGIHELQIQDGVTGFFEAQRAEHRVIGLQSVFRNGIELSLDAYEKRYDRLYPRFENVFDPYEFAPESHFDRIRVDADEATARGVELVVRRRRQRGLDWWASYTWARVEDEIAGETVPRPWDQRHSLTANLTWHGERWSFSAVARYHDGWPTTPLLVDAIVDGAGTVTAITSDFSQRNVTSFEDYLRVDVRASRTLDVERGEVEFYLDVFNVLNADNECCIADFDLDFAGGVSATPNVDGYLPLFPSFGFVWRFGDGAG